MLDVLIPPVISEDCLGSPFEIQTVIIPSDVPDH